MRAVWTGLLNFGLVNIPVKLYSASHERSLPLNFLHKQDLTPIRYARICPEDGKEIPMEDIVRGYKYRDDSYVVLTKEDFKRADPRKTKIIEILDFTDMQEIDPVYFEKPCYLAPQSGAEKAYALLWEALDRSGKAAIGRSWCATASTSGR